MTAQKSSYRRSELDRLEFASCRQCQETICWTTVKGTAKRVPVDPKPQGQSDPVYKTHICKQEDE